MAMTEPPPPCSWVPPSVPGAFNTIFPSVPSAEMAAFGISFMGAIENPVITDSCVVVTTRPQGITSQQVAPPQALPFVSERTQPSPSVGVELFKRTRVFHSKALSYSFFEPFFRPYHFISLCNTPSCVRVWYCLRLCWCDGDQLLDSHFCLVN